MGSEPSERSTARGAWAFWGLGLLVLLANVTLVVVGGSDLALADRVPTFVADVSGLFYLTIGLLIVLRARNRIGWILLATGTTIELVGLSGLYPLVGLRARPGSLPAPEVVGALLQNTFQVLTILVAAMLLVFPTGSLPSARWRPVIRVLVVGGTLSYLGLLVVPKKMQPVSGLSFANPFLIRPGNAIIGAFLVAAGWATAIAGIACLWALVVRFRRGGPELREQIKWLTIAVAGSVVCALSGFVSLITCRCDNSTVAIFGFLGFVSFMVIGVPSAIAVAVLKYRLYDIDLIIRKAVLYTLLAAFFTGVYIAIVLGVGAAVGSSGNSFLTIAAAVVIAVAFQPVRDRARRLANRIVYGARATPYEVLAEFSDRVAETYSSEDVLPRMAEILASGTGAEAAHIWLRFGHELRETASWPSNGDLAPLPLSGDRVTVFPDGEHGVEVRHQGELLGALSVETPPSDPMNPAKEKLVRDLAAQAGLVLRNVRLIEELRASRRRIVTAQDERAKALERNIHDGAQQQLVALGVQLGLAERLAGNESPAMLELLGNLKAQAIDALENLRDLARGIYPPLLADKGLSAALESQVRKSAVPASLEAGPVGRYPQDVEAAVYFCVLEALNNVAKYAGATSATVRLTSTQDSLDFEVQDDGAGFDQDVTSYGTGLQGMADRLEAIGGVLEVASSPGRGTTITGRVPVRS